MLEPSLARLREDRYHSPQLEVTIRLNTNESPIPPSQGFLEGLGRRLGALELNRYPDREARDLREALGARHGVGPEMVFVANGSNEVLQSILLAYGGPGRHVWIAQPTYGMYARIAATTRTEVIEGGRRHDGRIDPDGHLDGAELVMICDPNNPTGRPEDPRLLEVPARHPERLFVVDRAYAEFEVAEPHPWRGGGNVVEVRTLSKAFSLAGLRLGYAIAAPEVVEALEAVALPYHVSALTQGAALEAMAHAEELTQAVELVVRERGFLAVELAKLGCEVEESATNFLLFSLPGRPARAIWEGLVARSVLVRDASSWPGVGDALRVTVGLPTENRAFLTALAEVR
jgi:histidinol-phosphate aminotransferase